MKLFLIIVLFIAGAVGAGTTHCHFCAERDAATCFAKQRNQTCAADPNSLGTAHCASAVVRYRNQSGKILDGFFRGCINCTSNKTAMYAAIGGLFISSKGWFLIQGKTFCCTGSNCNSTIPILPDAHKRHCNFCVASNATTCLSNQRDQTCTTDPDSFGTTHCASAVVTYEDRYGKVLSGFMRGCINCANKRTACAAIRSDVKRFYGWTLRQCEIECCTDNNCNDHTPTLPPKALAVSAATSSPGRRHVFFSGMLVFAVAFVNIFYHM